MDVARGCTAHEAACMNVKCGFLSAMQIDLQAQARAHRIGQKNKVR